MLGPHLPELENPEEPLVSGRGKFRFHRTCALHGVRCFPRLAEACAGCAFDVDELARMLALLGNGRPGGTIYEGVDWHFHDEAAPSTLTSTEPRSGDAAVEIFRAYLDDVVDRMAGEATRIAVLTGGGLDSGGLLAYAMRWARRGKGRSVFASTVDFAANGDDRPHLAALESKLGCEVVRVFPEQAARGIDDILEGVDASPYIWPTAPFEAAALAAARERGAEVVLTGVGGDELLDGHGVFLSGLFASGRVREAWSMARRLEGCHRPPLAPLQWLIRPLLGPWVPRALRIARLRRLERPAPRWAGPVLRRAIVTARERSLDLQTRHLPRGVEFRSRAHRVPIAWLRHQESIVSGIERRDPFLDLGLVEHVTRLAPHWLLHGARRRGLFRETLRGEVPESFRLRMDKAAFEPGMERWLASAGGFKKLAPLTSATMLAALGIVEPKPFMEAFAQLANGHDDGSGWVLLFPALTVEAFLRARRS